MKITFYLKYKKIIFNILIFGIIFFLLFNSEILIKSIHSSIDLFLYKLIPALFPYLLITELLINSGRIYNISYGLSGILSKIFRIPPHTTSTVLVGFLLGYPNAAKCILKMYNEHQIDEKVAVKLMSFTSNANPSYIIATLGIGIFKSAEIGLILAISHYLSAIIIGMLLTPSYTNNIIQQRNTNSNSFNKISSPFELLSISILGSLKTLAFIFSYTIIFSLIPTVILSKFNLADIIKAMTIGIFEISNGINNIAILDLSLNSKILLTSFILSFSSIMIIVQIYSYLFKAKVPFKKLLKYKLLQGVISCLLTYVGLKYINNYAISVFNNSNYLNHASNISPYITLFSCLLLIICICLITFGKKRQEKPVA